MGIHTMESAKILEHLKVASDQVTAMQTELEAARKNQQELEARIPELEARLATSAQSQEPGSKADAPDKMAKIEPSPLQRARREGNNMFDAEQLLKNRKGLGKSEIDFWVQQIHNLHPRFGFLMAAAEHAVKELGRVDNCSNDDRFNARRQQRQLEEQNEELKQNLSALEKASPDITRYVNKNNELSTALEELKESNAKLKAAANVLFNENQFLTWGYSDGTVDGSGLGDFVPIDDNKSMSLGDFKWLRLAKLPEYNAKIVSFINPEGGFINKKLSTLKRFQHMAPNYSVGAAGSGRDKSPARHNESSSRDRDRSPVRF